MTDKLHQERKSEYQVRVNGKPVLFCAHISRNAFNAYRELCRDSPDCYVDIVRVSTDIILCQAIYHDFKRHFETSNLDHGASNEPKATS
jgi:hypothetical protein